MRPDVPSHNLPPQPLRLFGRERDLTRAEVAAWAARRGLAVPPRP